MKLNLNFNSKTYFMFAAGIFVGGLGLCYLTYTANGEQARALEVLKKDLRDEKQVQKELDESIKKVEEISNKLQHLEKGVPSFAYNATLLKELERYGINSKVVILEVKPMPAPVSMKKEGEKKKPFEELNINVKARGTYDDALRFISALKSFPKVVAIRSVSLTPKIEIATDQKQIPSLDIDLEVRAFLFKDDVKRAKPLNGKDAEGEGDQTAAKQSAIKQPVAKAKGVTHES
jgi:Tfp pilus assembly protein PilO